MGLVVNRIDVNVMDITVRRNNISSLNLNSQNFIVAQNIITNNIDGRNCKGLVSNNIIRYYASFDTNSFVSFFNNILNFSSNFSTSIDISNSEIRNNIIYSYTTNGLFLTSETTQLPTIYSVRTVRKPMAINSM